MENNNLDLAIKIAIQRFQDEQKKTLEINTRAIKLIGYTAGLGSIYFGIISPKLTSDGLLIYLTILIFIIDIIVTVLSLLASNFLLEEKYKSGPGSKLLETKSLSSNELEFKKMILNSYSKAYDNNYRLNKKSAYQLQLASILFALGFCIGFFGFMIDFLT